MRPLNIFQVSPPYLPLGPELTYGGIERNISYLDSLFSQLGHNSIVAAPGDSRVEGELLDTIPQSLWVGEGNAREFVIDDVLGCSQHYKNIIDHLVDNTQVDIVHDHPGESLLSHDYFWNHIHRIHAPILTTLHAYPFPQELKKFDKLEEAHRYGLYFNSISHSQKRLFEEQGFKINDVVYHGIPAEQFPFNDNPQGYLFNIGRIDSYKGQDVAIHTARALGMPLILAGEVREPEFFEREIAPYIDNENVYFVGGLNDEEKAQYYKDASAFLMPIRWEEPFGLVMPEAMACGTPVVAYERGSVPEVVDEGTTGHIVPQTGDYQQDLESFIEATRSSLQLDRKKCRQRVDDWFTVETEARNYLNLYERLIAD